MKMKKHYHVMSGLRGCYMPDCNDIYPTRKNAEDGMRFIRDANFGDGEVKQKGSVKDGVIVWGYKDQTSQYPYIIEIRGCTDSNCESEDE